MSQIETIFKVSKEFRYIHVRHGVIILKSENARGDVCFMFYCLKCKETRLIYIINKNCKSRNILRESVKYGA
jgi:hypothetical protein